MSDNEEIHESEDDVRNDEWLKDNYIDLMLKHAREWIAVMDRKIIAISSTEMEVREKANKIAGEKEFSVYFIAPTSAATDTSYQEG